MDAEFVAELDIQPKDNLLKVSAYDRTVSMLVALLILVGFAVLLLFLILLTRRVLASQLTVPVEFVEELAGDVLRMNYWNRGSKNWIC